MLFTLLEFKLLLLHASVVLLDRLLLDRQLGMRHIKVGGFSRALGGRYWGSLLLWGNELASSSRRNSQTVGGGGASPADASGGGGRTRGERRPLVLCRPEETQP